MSNERTKEEQELMDKYRIELFEAIEKQVIKIAKKVRIENKLSHYDLDDIISDTITNIASIMIFKISSCKHTMKNNAEILKKSVISACDTLFKIKDKETKNGKQ